MNALKFLNECVAQSEKYLPTYYFSLLFSTNQNNVFLVFLINATNFISFKKHE